GLRGVDSEVFNHDQTVGTHQLSKDGAQSSAIHLLVQLLVMIAGGRSKGHTTATPDRTTSGTGTSTTGALLTPWALTATSDIGTGLLTLGTLTAASHVGHNCLVNQSLVELATEGRIGHFDRLSAIYIQLHLRFSPYALAAGRTITSPPVAPGTAPLTR